MRLCGGACQRAITSCQPLTKLLWRESTITDPEQRTHQAAYHPLQEGISLYIKVKKRFLTPPLGPQHLPDRILPLRRLAKGGKVLFSNQATRGLIHTVHIQQLRHVKGPSPA